MLDSVLRETLSTDCKETKIPQVELSGMTLLVNGWPLSLSRKSRAYRLVHVFCQSSAQNLTTERLVTLLRLEEGLSTSPSERARKSEEDALVRMISRIRREFSKAFRSMTPEGFSWFYFDRINKKWVFFRMPGLGYDGYAY